MRCGDVQDQHIGHYSVVPILNGTACTHVTASDLLLSAGHTRVHYDDGDGRGVRGISWSSSNISDSV